MDAHDAFRRDLLALLPRLRRFATALTGASEDAEDLVQGAVERALRQWRLFGHGRQLDTWIFKSVQDAWIEAKRIAAQQTEWTEAANDTVVEDGRDVFASRDDLRIAQEAISALPEEQRAVLALVVLEGMSYSETATALAIPIGTVMSRLARARATLAAQVRRPTHLSLVSSGREKP